jgi:hypothetical protein
MQKKKKRKEKKRKERERIEINRGILKKKRLIREKLDYDRIKYWLKTGLGKVPVHYRLFASDSKNPESRLPPRKFQDRRRIAKSCASPSPPY